VSLRPIVSLLLLALGCHKDAAPPPAVAQPSPPTPPAPPAPALADAAVVDAPAAPRFVELLHAVPATVRVSSRVANPAILPAHLVDRDLATAWNSATGDLVGAWIEITVPDAATIAEVRLTAGHTGKGPKGEDYFTMNPRIAKVSVAQQGTALGTFAIATERRDLQSLRVKASGGTLRIVIEEIVPGSKKSWREAAISELEVWGVPPPGWKPPPAPLSPKVEVGDPTAGTEDSVDALCAARLVEPLKASSSSINTAPPSCGSQAFALPGLKPPFTGVASTCVIPSHGVMERARSFDCAIAIASDGRWWSGLAIPQPMPPDDPPRDFFFDVEVFETIAVNLPDPMLVIRYRTTDKNEPERFTVCRATPRRGCTEPIQTEGADWKTRPRQVGADLVVERQSGTPPEDELGIVTGQLRFP